MTKDFPTKKNGQRIKVCTKMDKNGFGEVEKMRQFCNKKFNIMKIHISIWYLE